jgi:hypothetical protein
MTYLFIKNLLKRKVCIIFIKNLKFRKTQKTFLVGFFGWVFYCQPWEQEGGEYFATCSPEVVSVVALAEQLTPGSKVRLKKFNSKTAYFFTEILYLFMPQN